MREGTLRKGLVVGIILLFVETCIYPTVIGSEPLNQPPLAEIVSIIPNPSFTYEQVNITGKGLDPENGMKYFSWDFNGDGIWDVYNTNSSPGWAYDYESYTYSSAGNYTVFLRVNDSQGDSGYDYAYVEILTLPPTVDITSPYNGQIVNGTTMITGTASDLDGYVFLVEVKIDEGYWNVATGTNNWEFSWDTHTVEEGNHTIYARSLDNNVNYSAIDTVNVITKFIPDLKCTRTLSWTGITPGATITGNFFVQNIGEIGSGLDWEVAEYPSDWGVWTFAPSNGIDLKPEDGVVMVNVTVIVPSQQSHQFSGDIKIVNKADSNDFEIISVSLTTPQNLAINSPLLSFLQNHPFMFPILRHMLGY